MDQDLFAMQDRFRKNRIEKRKRSIEGVLSNIRKQKLFSTIVLNVRKEHSKLSLESKKFVLDHNYSTMTMRVHKKRQVKHNNPIETNKVSNNLSSERHPSEASSPRHLSRKNSIQKKGSIQLPSLSSFLRPTEINSKDRLLQQLFLKMTHSRDFIYNIVAPRKFLSDFLTKEFSREFSNFVCWFFDIRLQIDYKYYLDIGEKLLHMSTIHIAHFTYMAFEGFNLESSFRMFKDNFGLRDLLEVTKLRNELVKDESQPIVYRRMNYESLKNGRHGIAIENDQPAPKMATVYLRTFMHYDSKKVGDDDRDKQIGRDRLNGELSFEEFCGYFADTLPHLYIEVMYKMFLVEPIEGSLTKQEKSKYAYSIQY